jgi:hypothetical protein
LAAFDIMRKYTKFILGSPVGVVFTGGLLLACGCLSTPRDFSSPPASIRVLDQSGSPISGIEVGRSWYDSDCNTNGSETIATGLDGTAQFTKIPAHVGVFTGAWRKTYSSLGPCGSGSGTWTTIRVFFAGNYDVVPKEKPLHRTKYGSFQDQDGVSFYTNFDSRSNTMANLSFPRNSKAIDYVLSAKPHTQ